MKFAYFGFPHVGGTFSVYRHLRRGLMTRGIEVQWVGLGPGAQAVGADPRWRDERAHGFAVSLETGADRQNVAALIEAIDRENFDGVFVNVLSDRVQTNAVRYLPRQIRRIMIVHSITPGTYAAAGTVRNYVHGTACISRRIRDHLIEWQGFDPEWTSVIPNATDIPADADVGRKKDAGRLAALYLGRIEDQSKGVFWLPSILTQLPGAVTLTVAGEGPDLAPLKERCAALGTRVNFLGAVPHQTIGDLVASHDVLIAPSRFEGFLITLVEAMAKGCVPVASLIRGVTDTIVTDGADGFLFPVGDTATAARYVQLLLEDRARLDAMRRRAATTVANRFTVDLMAEGYAELIRRAIERPRPIEEPLGLDNWHIPGGLKPGLRTYLPKPVKNFLRTMRERIA